MLVRFCSLTALVTLLGTQAALARPAGDEPAPGRAQVIHNASVLETRAQQAEAVEKQLYIQLFNDRNFGGRNLTYGPHKRCGTLVSFPVVIWGLEERTNLDLDTLDVFGRYTDSRTSWMSAKILVEDACCLLYPSFGCKGQGTMLGGSIPDLSAYGVGNQLRSVYCMPKKNCIEYYTMEKYLD